MTVTELWKAFSILNCVEIVAASIKELKQSTLNGSWKKIWPQVVSKSNEVPSLSVEVNRIVQVAHDFSGEGFEDMIDDDIYDLLNDAQDLNEEELVLLTTESDPNVGKENIYNSEDDSDEPMKDFTLKSLREALNSIKRSESLFTDNDPSMERSNQFKRQLQISLAPYFELEKQLLKSCKQGCITDFLTAKPVEKSLGQTTKVVNNENYVEEISSDEAIRPVNRSVFQRNVISDSDSD